MHHACLMTTGNNYDICNIGSSTNDRDSNNFSCSLEELRKKEKETVFLNPHLPMYVYPPKQAIIYFLQSQNVINQPLTKKLDRSHYRVIYPLGDSSPHTAIAISESLFKEVKYYFRYMALRNETSIDQMKSVTFVTATEIETDFRFLFVSICASEFNQKQLEKNEEWKQIQIQKTYNLCTKVLEEIEKIQKFARCHVHIIGTDLFMRSENNESSSLLLYQRGFISYPSHFHSDEEKICHPYFDNKIPSIFIKSANSSFPSRLYLDVKSCFELKPSFIEKIDLPDDSIMTSNALKLESETSNLISLSSMRTITTITAVMGLTTYIAYKIFQK